LIRTARPLYADEDLGLDLVSTSTFNFLTNNFAIPAQTVADLYRYRRQVELFFKPERRHFSRNPKRGASDFGYKQWGAGHCLRRPAFILRPSRRALRAAPGFPQ